MVIPLVSRGFIECLVYVRSLPNPPALPPFPSAFVANSAVLKSPVITFKDKN